MYNYKNMMKWQDVVASNGSDNKGVEGDMYDLLKQQAESETPAETDAEVRRFMDAVLTDYLD